MTELFAGTKEQFKKEFEALCEKYGFYQWFYAIAESEDEYTDTMNGSHSEITESLIGYLEEEIEELRERYDRED